MPITDVKFLIVDDLEENLITLEAVLRREGLVIHKARSGTQALELLLEHEFALAIVDVQMPGMDGIELAEYMRGMERTKHVPIIFLTAADQDTQHRFRGYESGAVDFLNKPLEQHILRSKADVFLNLYLQRQALIAQHEALRASEERFRVVQQTSPDGFMIFRSLRDEQGEIIDFIWEYTNPAAETIVNRNGDELLGQRLLEVLPGNKVEGLFDAYVTVVETGKTWQREFEYARDGINRWFRSTAAKVADGFAVSFADVTYEKQTLIALRESEERLRLRERELRSITENSPNIIARFNRDLKHVFVNDAVERFTGMPSTAFLNKTNRELGMDPHLCDEWDDAINSVFATGEGCTISFDFPSPDSYRRFESQLIAEPSVDGIIHHVLTVTRDVTAEWQSTSQLNRAKEAAESANKAKDSFLALVSHELRTPMTAILGYTDIVLERTDDPELVEYLKIVRQNGDYLLDIINDILDLSKIEAAKLDIVEEYFSPKRAVEDLRRIMEVRATEKGLKLNIRFDGEIPEVIVSDSKRLKQILINLIGNAIKFTKEGHVTLTVKSASDAKLAFEVSDTGIGMTDEQIKKLFKPFSQGDSSVSRQFGGTGLGLAISLQLANMLGGTIVASSSVGKGSTFLVTIATGNVDTAKLAMREHGFSFNPQKQVADGLQCKILIVDDRRDIRFLSKRLLAKSGASVAEVEDGQLAIDYVMRAFNTREHPDLILLDMQMPVLDGYSTAKMLRQIGYTQPIVALTGDAMLDDRNRCIECGCTTYLSKPIQAALLIETVRQLTSPDE